MSLSEQALTGASSMRGIGEIFGRDRSVSSGGQLIGRGVWSDPKEEAGKFATPWQVRSPLFHLRKVWNVLEGPIWPVLSLIWKGTDGGNRALSMQGILMLHCRASASRANLASLLVNLEKDQSRDPSVSRREVSNALRIPVIGIFSSTGTQGGIRGDRSWRWIIINFMSLSHLGERERFPLGLLETAVS